MSAEIRRLLDKWRAQAVVVEGTTTCVNYAFYHCADDLEALLDGRPNAQKTEPTSLPRLSEGVPADDGAATLRPRKLQEVTDAVSEPCRAGRDDHASIALLALPGRQEEPPTVGQAVVRYMAEWMAMPDATTDQEQNWIAGHLATFAWQMLRARPGAPVAQDLEETNDEKSLARNGKTEPPPPDPATAATARGDV